MNNWNQTSISHVFMVCTVDRQSYIFRGSEGITFVGVGEGGGELEKE
jgi:hypothetical protein